MPTPALPLLKKVPLTLQEWDPVAVWSSWLCLQRHWALQDLGSKVARLLSQNSPTSSGRDGMKQNMRQRHWPMLQGTDMSVKRVRPALDRAWSSHVNVSPKPTHTHTHTHTHTRSHTLSHISTHDRRQLPFTPEMIWCSLSKCPQKHLDSSPIRKQSHR